MTDPNSSLPAWQLPPGVCRGTWDYLTSPEIATEYDCFHHGHPLLELDQQLIAKHRPPNPGNEPQTVIDLGCGTGRSILPLASQGWHAIGVDLSQEMLNELQRKRDAMQLQDRVQTVRANIVELTSIPSESADLILCMYSSIGMVRGQRYRRMMLDHVRRIAKPEARFIVHVHNRGTWWRDPNGISLTIGGWLRSLRDPSWELGDRVYHYRNLPSMFLHIFSERELKRELRLSGLALDAFYRLNRESSGLLKRSWLMPHLRAGGFIAVSTKG